MTSPTHLFFSAGVAILFLSLAASLACVRGEVSQVVFCRRGLVDTPLPTTRYVRTFLNPGATKQKRTTGGLRGLTTTGTATKSCWKYSRGHLLVGMDFGSITSALGFGGSLGVYTGQKRKDSSPKLQ